MEQLLIGCYYCREDRLENTVQLITDLEQELEDPGSSPLYYEYTNQLKNTDNTDSLSNNS